MNALGSVEVTVKVLINDPNSCHSVEHPKTMKHGIDGILRVLKIQN